MYKHLNFCFVNNLSLFIHVTLDLLIKTHKNLNIISFYLISIDDRNAFTLHYLVRDAFITKPTIC
jgi:hypothetical protein